MNSNSIKRAAMASIALPKKVQAESEAEMYATKDTTNDYHEHMEEEYLEYEKCDEDTELCAEKEMKLIVEEPGIPSLVDEIRIYQATMMVCSCAMKSMHYCVVGHGFYTVHEKLEEFYKELESNIDEVAELLMSYNYMPITTLSEAIKLSKSPELSLEGRITCKEAMAEALTGYDHLAYHTSEIARMLDDKGMLGSSSIFAEHYNSFVKESWMMKAFLKDYQVSKSS